MRSSQINAEIGALSRAFAHQLWIAWGVMSLLHSAACGSIGECDRHQTSMEHSDIANSKATPTAEAHPSKCQQVVADARRIAEAIRGSVPSHGFERIREIDAHLSYPGDAANANAEAVAAATEVLQRIRDANAAGPFSLSTNEGLQAVAYFTEHPELLSDNDISSILPASQLCVILMYDALGDENNLIPGLGTRIDRIRLAMGLTWLCSLRQSDGSQQLSRILLGMEWLERSLHDGLWTEADGAQLQDLLCQLGPLRMSRAIVMEQRARASRTIVDSHSTDDDPVAAQAAVRSELAEAQRYYDRLEQFLRRPVQERFDIVVRKHSEKSIDEDPVTGMVSDWASNLRSWFAEDTNQTHMNGIILAIALARHKQAEKKEAAHMEDVVRYAPCVVVDATCGLPFVFRPSDEASSSRAMVYARGFMGSDDGGKMPDDPAWRAGAVRASGWNEHSAYDWVPLEVVFK